MYFRSWPRECNLKSEDKPTVPNRAILILKSRLKTRFWPEKHNFLVIKLPNHKDVKSYGCYIDINRMVKNALCFDWVNTKSNMKMTNWWISSSQVGTEKVWLKWRVIAPSSQYIFLWQLPSQCLLVRFKEKIFNCYHVPCHKSC